MREESSNRSFNATGDGPKYYTHREKEREQERYMRERMRENEREGERKKERKRERKRERLHLRLVFGLFLLKFDALIFGYAVCT